MDKYTVIVTDENGSYDSIHKIEVEPSATIEEIHRIALTEAAEQWECDINACMVRGVIAGHVTVIEWTDHPNENSL